MLSSVRSRLTLWYAAVLTATLLLFSLVIYWIVRRSVQERFDAGLIELSDSFLATVQAELVDATPAKGVVAAARQSMLEHQYPGHSFAVVAPGGELLASSADFPAKTDQRSEPNPVITGEVMQECLRSFSASADPFHSFPGGRGGQRCYTRAFSAQRSPYRLIILASLRPESRLLRRVRVALAWLIPLTVVLASCGGYFLARKNLAPVADMTARADRIGETTLHDRLRVGNPNDELGRLAATFNRLLDRLDSAFERQRRFIADASHELRTPLAILQGESEVALSKTDRSLEEYRESLNILQNEARRLARIVDDMFTLSRADAGQYPVNLREVYVDELVAECAQAVRSLAAAKSIELTVESNGELPVAADEELLSRMVMNLLDNAIKYTPAGGKVGIATAGTADGAQITVSDNGAGIPVELQPRIFERFFRADQARTRGPSGGGAGLGLSIAKWIAEVHHGTLVLSRSDMDGTVFTARLPRGGVSSTASH